MCDCDIVLNLSARALEILILYHSALRVPYSASVPFELVYDVLIVLSPFDQAISYQLAFHL